MKSRSAFTIRKYCLCGFMIACLFFLSSCKVELYSNLQEREINEMLSILIRNGISCEKVPGEEMTWNLFTQEEEIARAVEVLSKNGYPKDKFQTMGKIFKKEGLISSPLEERIRFIYALSQEVSATISKIDGVLAARVHIVLPENDPLSDKLVPSSASVFIKHQPNSNIESSVLKIKELVVNSIEGLEYKKVSVALFPAVSGMDASEGITSHYVKILGVNIAPGSAMLFRVIVVAQFLLLLGAIVVILYLYRRFGISLKDSQTPLMQNIGKRLLGSKQEDE